MHCFLICLHSKRHIAQNPCSYSLFLHCIMAVSLEWTVKIVSEKSSKSWNVPSALMKKVEKADLAWDFWLQIRASSPGLLSFLFPGILPCNLSITQCTCMYIYLYLSMCFSLVSCFPLHVPCTLRCQKR